MTHSTLLAWLLEPDPQRLEPLWRQADRVRRDNVGDQVHLRGLIEVSNVCVRLCGYCGLRAPNRAVERYRMTADEILAAARQAAGFGYGTVVLQAGEDPALTCDFISGVVWRIKRETDLAVTLSLGERTADEFSAWKNAGADRYLLRFETSNRPLFEQIHPPRPGVATDRVGQLRALRQLGFEVGSGVMIGIPGQTYDDLARDLELFRELDLDMIGCGPFLAHPATPLGAVRGSHDVALQNPDRERAARERGHESGQGGQFAQTRDPQPASSESAAPSAGPARGVQFLPELRAADAALRDAPRSSLFSQAPSSELMTYKMIALARLVCPRANIPSTTALATLNRAQGRELGLMRGANIVMPNLTPTHYRAKYEIYPDKACLFEDARECHECMQRRIESIGRTVGAGRGDSPNWRNRGEGAE